MSDAPQTSPPTPAAFRIVARRSAWDELRKLTNLHTDDALASAMRVSQTTVSRVLAGTVDPSGKFIGHAMATFGRLVPFERLFNVTADGRAGS